MKKIILLVFVFSFLLYSCGSQKHESLEYFSLETECLGPELDGSQSLRAWGKGKKKNDAIEKAKKNALKDVLFNGIRKGKSGCNVIPLVVEVNAQQKYQDYFNKFFSKKRIYSKYVSNKNNSLEEEHNGEYEVVYGIQVSVLRNKLRDKLLKDRIIKK